MNEMLIPELSGAVITRSIQMMEELDIFAKKILKENGIEQFHEDKWYPREIHNNILEEVRKKLGDSALIAIGFSTSKVIDAHITSDLEGDIKKLSEISEYENIIKNSVFIDEFVLKLSDLINFGLKTYARNHPSTLGFSIKKIHDNHFLGDYSTFPVIAHTKYCEGMIYGFFRRVFPSGWSIQVIHNKDMPTRESGSSTDYFDVHLSKGHESISRSELVLKETLQMKRNLLVSSVKSSLESEERSLFLLKTLMESVNYASRLQKGQLPRQERIEGRFSSFATIWEPRDTIGGDLYWLSSSQQSGPFVLCVADCTGHGVPGAMLSLLVSNSLARIHANDNSEDPATALMSLDHYVRTGLNQDKANSESDDGCDAAVLRIDRDNHSIEFAGAKLGLFQVNAQGVLTRHLGSRCSLGYQDAVVEADKPVVKKIPYQSGDVFAVVTDGFTDQVGGSTGKTSFGYRRLEEILKANFKSSAEEITAAMKSEFAAWQGANAQRDDVTAVVFSL